MRNKNGYNTENIKLESASDTLKRRIYAPFYKEEFTYMIYSSKRQQEQN